MCLNPKLEIVSMNSCDIDASGGEPIGNTLAHAMWRELRLNNNKLGSVGAANVVKGLAHNISLISIELQVSPFIVMMLLLL